MNVAQVLATEFLKLRRSLVTWLTWLAISIMPLVGGLFMWVLLEPDRASRLGLLGQKAQLAAFTADWSSFLGLLLQITGVGGMILVAVIAAYVFGREYSQGTAKNLLGLPIGRHWFAVAKLVVVLVWFGALIVWPVEGMDGSKFPGPAIVWAGGAASIAGREAIAVGGAGGAPN